TPRSVLPTSDMVQKFAPAAVQDAARRASEHFQQDVDCFDIEDWEAVLADRVNELGCDAIVTARLPLGPVRTRLERAAKSLAIPLIEVTRAYDRVTWPHAKKGFFGLKKKIPAILSSIDLG
ncbi:MAG: hypothetical protein AAFV54_09185, partial [Pseudomonadota bacterium]